MTLVGTSHLRIYHMVHTSLGGRNSSVPLLIPQKYVNRLCNTPGDQSKLQMDWGVQNSELRTPLDGDWGNNPPISRIPGQLFRKHPQKVQGVENMGLVSRLSFSF